MNKYELFDNEKTDILLVISRYNEDLDWLKNEPFSKYNNIIYNKGINNDFHSNEKSKIINLPNIGREGETYIHHIIDNYDNLNEITIFLPGSINISFKLKNATILINEVEKHKDTVFVSSFYENVKTNLYNFKIDSYSATEQKNKLINPESNLKLSKIRPYGKWFEFIFGDIHIQHVAYWGILAISKKDILNHSKEYYKKLQDEFENDSNPEIGHYIERSWNAIFYPLNNPHYIVVNSVKEIIN